ncbi:hypothetical protein [Desulfocurvus vexinensis]|uniref:hypothetical protein n=1 Tax=Desulfocurvus vexinensis TaxID=399548 RepID=UPI00048F6CC9|nr:hypothetical protein [Desulfocurvus vexinensis]
MLVRRVELLRCLAAPGGTPGLVLVLRRVEADAQGCRVALAPFVVAAREAGAPQALGPSGCLALATASACAGPGVRADGGVGPWALVRLRPFCLEVRRGKARFDRDIRLPPALRGLGLGTYLLATLVRVAVGLGHAEARVRALHLVSRDASPLRDAFYRSMRFTLTLWPDGSGWARARRLGDLRAGHDPARVRALGPAAALALLAGAGGLAAPPGPG